MVAALTEIAGTLDAFASEGVAHRDIKPDNLFRLGGQCVIGDFGLVTYPEKDPRTAHGRRLGPTDYMAPERCATTPIMRTRVPRMCGPWARRCGFS